MIALYMYIFLFGITIGSFLNVLIYRIPAKENISSKRSICPHCNTIIKAYDLIPVFSYILLKGKCRTCKQSISIRYPIVELLTGISCILCFHQIGWNILALSYTLIGCIFITLSFIDIDTFTLPDKLLLLFFIISIIISCFSNDISFLSRIIGFFVVSLPMFLVTYFIDGAFGGGDIKLMAICGYLLGPIQVGVAIFLAILIGGSWASYLLFIKKSSNKQMAFGPSLCLGSYIALLYGNAILQWYLSFF